MKEILMSQLIKLIEVSFDTRNIKLSNLSFELAFADSNTNWNAASGSFELSWVAGKKHGFSSRKMHLNLSFKERVLHRRVETNKRIRPMDEEFVFYAYNFHGDNCNKQSRFIYELLADSTPIIDDLNIVYSGDSYSRKSMEKIDPFECRFEKINGEPYRR